jgi:SH3-like domain-containing protein
MSLAHRPVQASLTGLTQSAPGLKSSIHGHFLRSSYQMVVTRQSMRTCAALLLAAAAFALAQSGPALAAGGETTGSVSGLPVPRFVSLKSDRVNVRGGPNKAQDVRWVYTRVGMPVEITAEFENWRRIRDWEGAEGWVYHSLLSGRRTAVIVPKNKDELVPLYENSDDTSPIVAKLQSGVLATLKSCTGTWCRLTGKNFDGYIRQERLWGAYPNEKVE